MQDKQEENQKLNDNREEGQEEGEEILDDDYLIQLHRYL